MKTFSTIDQMKFLVKHNFPPSK